MELLTKYCVISIETTGLNPETDMIIKLTLTKHENNLMTDKYTTLVYTKKILSEFIENYTGIIQEDLTEDLPKQDDIAKIISEFVKDYPLLTFNGTTFTKRFLEKRNYKLDNYIDVIDFLKIHDPFKLIDHQLQTIHYYLYKKSYDKEKEFSTNILISDLYQKIYTEYMKINPGFCDIINEFEDFLIKDALIYQKDFGINAGRKVKVTEYNVCEMDLPKFKVEKLMSDKPQVIFTDNIFTRRDLVKKNE